MNKLLIIENKYDRNHVGKKVLWQNIITEDLCCF